MVAIDQGLVAVIIVQFYLPPDSSSNSPFACLHDKVFCKACQYQCHVQTLSVEVPSCPFDLPATRITYPGCHGIVSFQGRRLIWFSSHWARAASRSRWLALGESSVWCLGYTCPHTLCPDPRLTRVSWSRHSSHLASI